MSPDDIPVASPVETFLWSAIDWLNPIVYITGLVIAVWAFRYCRRWGYLVVGFYFVFVLFTLLAMPTVKRAIAQRRTPDISEQTQQKINAAVQQTIDRVLKEEGQHYAPPQKRTVRFPFGPMILVAGLWLIARRDIEDHRASER